MLNGWDHSQRGNPPFTPSGCFQRRSAGSRERGRRSRRARRSPRSSRHFHGPDAELRPIHRVMQAPTWARLADGLAWRGSCPANLGRPGFSRVYPAGKSSAEGRRVPLDCRDCATRRPRATTRVNSGCISSRSPVRRSGRSGAGSGGTMARPAIWRTVSAIVAEPGRRPLVAGTATADIIFADVAVRRAAGENDEMAFVVDAAVVVARDGWRVFPNADDKPGRDAAPSGRVSGRGGNQRSGDGAGGRTVAVAAAGALGVPAARTQRATRGAADSPVCASSATARLCARRHRGRGAALALQVVASVTVSRCGAPAARQGARALRGKLNMTIWATSPTTRRPGELLTRSDVCHLHENRREAELCGALLGGAPDLVRLDEIRPRVFVVAWSLSATADGRLRRPAAPIEPRPNPGDPTP